ncbi:MICOS complex subunit mic19 [Cytospora mali]|uniref:MICOS complex subunit mic19 n=1 Tax=Cytospora mali TaxID=578113 RepID=A0A194VBL0_CYTMA|nr:MICOS complex subunit mic19 [Valsa mali var. pyri (nom. inval.)]
MGSSSSKPSGTSPPHVWKGTSPASMSQELAESMQSSSETDTSRQQLTELQVQARVAAELKKLQQQEDARLKEMTDKIAAASVPEETPITRHEVSREIVSLRQRLEARRSDVREVPETVERARGEVVRCLTENDRRPLDCWKEVEKFKEEVRRLERGWVEKVIS